jgi:hypothetical protein
MAKDKKKKNKKPLTKKQKRKRIIITFLIIILAVLLVVFAINVGKKDENENTKKVVDEIKKFSYTVSDTDTQLFKDKFKELKVVLTKKNIDNKEYAKLISELFVIDFYTLDNKTTKNDVGGVQFVYESYKSDFVDKARDGMYKQVKSNIDNDRKQSLPEVSSIKVESIEEVVPSTIFESDDFKNETEASAYEVKLSWTYKNNDSFQKEATIVVVKDGEKLSIAKLD